MRTVKTIHKVKRNEQYGCYNATDKFVESHHKSLRAAIRTVAGRNSSWQGDMIFEVVIIEEN